MAGESILKNTHKALNMLIKMYHYTVVQLIIITATHRKCVNCDSESRVCAYEILQHRTLITLVPKTELQLI